MGSSNICQIYVIWLVWHKYICIMYCDSPASISPSCLLIYSSGKQWIIWENTIKLQKSLSNQHIIAWNPTILYKKDQLIVNENNKIIDKIITLTCHHQHIHTTVQVKTHNNPLAKTHLLILIWSHCVFDNTYILILNIVFVLRTCRKDIIRKIYQLTNNIIFTVEVEQKIHYIFLCSYKKKLHQQLPSDHTRCGY